MVSSSRGEAFGETVRFHEALRRLAMIDEVFLEDEAGIGLGPVSTSALDVKTAAWAAEQPHGDPELLDQVVCSLFRIGLSLQAAIDIPGAAVHHITSAQQWLEETIRTIRDHTFTDSKHQVHH